MKFQMSIQSAEVLGALLVDWERIALHGAPRAFSPFGRRTDRKTATRCFSIFDLRSRRRSDRGARSPAATVSAAGWTGRRQRPDHSGTGKGRVPLPDADMLRTVACELRAQRLSMLQSARELRDDVPPITNQHRPETRECAHALGRLPYPRHARGACARSVHGHLVPRRSS